MDKCFKEKLSAICKAGRLKEASKLLDEIDQRDNRNYSDACHVLLRACTRTRSLEDGRKIHDHIIKRTFKATILVGNTLINMYSKCGNVLDARKTFDQMAERDVFTWTTMITGYAQHGDKHEAIKLFGRMEGYGFNPSKVTYISVLSACAVAGTLGWGKYIHVRVMKSGLHSDIFVANTLIGMYVKCGNIHDARWWFDQMKVQNLVSWTAIISGYLQHGDTSEAMMLFQCMQGQNFKPDKVIYASILTACASVGALEYGRHIHSDLMNYKLESDTFVSNTLLGMYTKCGSIREARFVFDKMSKRDIFSWTTLISGYSQHGHGEEAMILFREMQEKGTDPNEVTYVSILSVCATQGAVELGKHIHAHLMKLDLEDDVFIGSTLIGMYAKCGNMKYACHMFDRMSKRNVISWNALISGYVQYEDSNIAIMLYRKMLDFGLVPDNVTYVRVLIACSNVRDVEWGKRIHEHLVEAGLEADIFVACTLVAMYAKCGSTRTAREVFDRMQVRNVITYTAMISGYAESEEGHKALELFRQMEREGIKPNRVSYISVLSACGNIGALDWGKHVHRQLMLAGLESDIVVGNSLVAMYAKCGSIDDACKAFNRMTAHDVISWNALISGNAQHGNARKAIFYFGQMQQHGVKPDRVTFISVLSACSHMGWVEAGRELFKSMGKIYGVVATPDHYACMVDLLGRAGCLQEAKDLIDTMSMPPDIVIWRAFLGACRNHGNVPLAEFALEQLLKLDHGNAAGFVLVSNVYAKMDKWNSQSNLIRLVEERATECSWKEVVNAINSLIVEDSSDLQNMTLETG